MSKCSHRSKTLEWDRNEEQGVGKQEHCIGGNVSLGGIKIAISHLNKDTLGHFLQKQSS